MTTVGFTTSQPLNIPSTAFNSDGIAALIVTGGRYGGAWVISALIGSDIIGSVKTEPTEDPDAAADAALAWMTAECSRLGLKVAHSVNHNDKYGPAERPFFTAAQVLVVDKDWI